MEQVFIQQHGRNVFAGTITKQSDGYFLATSPYEKCEPAVSEGGMSLRLYHHAKWYLELCLVCMPK